MGGFKSHKFLEVEKNQENTSLFEFLYVQYNMV